MYLFAANIRGCSEYKMWKDLWAINLEIIIYYHRVGIVLFIIPNVDSRSYPPA